jgi:site-specific recombinase XerD
MVKGVFMSLLRDRMIRDLERAGRAQHTIKQYTIAVRLLAKFHRKSPDLLTPDDIRGWEEELIRRHLSPSSRHVYLSAAAFLYRRTLGRPEMVSFITHARQRRKLPVTLSPEEIGRVLVAFRERRYRIFYALIFDTGLRISEAAKLKAGDVDRELKVIHVRSGKGGKDRQVKLGDKLLAMLRYYWREVRMKDPHPETLSKDSFLFSSKRGGPISIKGAREALGLAVRDAGISKHVTPHTFRHSFATTQLETGTDLPVIQAQLGHEDIGSTQIYLHVSTRLIRQAPSPLDLLDIP